jgi:hypothetical protein
MDAKNTPTINIAGVEYPVRRPSDGQLLGIVMLSKGNLPEEKSGELWLKAVMNMLGDDAQAAFISEYLDGRYTIKHLQKLVPDLLAAVGVSAAEPEAAAPAKKTARKAASPRKRT